MNTGNFDLHVYTLTEPLALTEPLVDRNDNNTD